MKRRLLMTFAVALVASAVFAQQDGRRRGRGPRPEGQEGQGQRPGSQGGQEGGRARFVPPILAAIDADQDGEISAEEIEGASAALKALDKDGDGKLSMDEWRRPAGVRDQAGGGAEFVQRIMQSDADGDGKITKEEAPERMQRAFDRIDTNGDGAIDKAEAEALAQRFQGGRGRRPGGEGDGGRGGDRPPRPQHPE